MFPEKFRIVLDPGIFLCVGVAGKDAGGDGAAAAAKRGNNQLKALMATTASTAFAVQGR